MLPGLYLATDALAALTTTVEAGNHPSQNAAVNIRVPTFFMRPVDVTIHITPFWTQAKSVARGVTSSTLSCNLDVEMKPAYFDQMLLASICNGDDCRPTWV